MTQEGRFHPSSSTVTSALKTARAVRVPIQIRRVTLHSVQLPLISKFRTAYGAMLRHRALLVRAEDRDGVVGWAETSAPDLPTFAPDTHDSSWYAITKLLAPRVVGKDFDSPASLADSWAELRGYNFAKHAMECAAWSIASQKTGRTLSQLWGGVRDSIQVGESFGIKDTVDELLEEIRQRLDEGYCRVKVKIAPGWDVEVMRAVANAFPDVPVSADGNCGYPSAAAGRWLELDKLGLLMIEQPLPAEALTEMADLQSSLRTALCLDEGASSPGITRAALRLGAARIVNIKPARIGGPLASMETHDFCQSQSVPVWCGGMLETGIGRGFNLALCSLPNFTLPADMSPAKIFYPEDLVEPTFDIRRDGSMAVPTGLGGGFPVMEERIDRYTDATWTSD